MFTLTLFVLRTTRALATATPAAKGSTIKLPVLSAPDRDPLILTTSLSTAKESRKKKLIPAAKVSAMSADVVWRTAKTPPIEVVFELVLVTYSGGNVAEETLTWPVNVPPANVGVAALCISCGSENVQVLSAVKFCAPALIVT